MVHAFISILTISMLGSKTVVLMSKSDTLLAYLFTDISNYNVTGAIE